MKKIFSVIVLCFLSASLFAGEMPSRHSISLNLGGPLSIGYFEYQYRLFQTPKSSISLSGGIGMNNNDIPVPLGVVYSYGSKSKLIFGLHYVPNFDLSGYAFESGEPFFQDSDLKNFSLRIGYSRTFNISEETFFIQAYFSPVIMIRESWNNVRNNVGLGFGVYL